MNRSASAIGIAVLVAGGLGWYLLRKGGNEATPAPAPGSAVAVDPVPQAHPPPRLPTAAFGSGSDVAIREGSDPSSYAVGGVAIRDHRSGANEPLAMTPNLHAPDSRKLPAPLVTVITGKLKQALYQCAAAIPREARGNQPRMDGQIDVAIKDHVMTVSTTKALLHDVVGAAVEPTQQCIEQKATELSTPAPDEADLANYTISVSYVIP